MKKLTLILGLLLPGICCFAQPKVQEKSGHKPGWINGVEKDYIIVSGTGASINAAQDNALMMIKERIVTSVADNVKATGTIQTEETNMNKKVFTFFEKYNSEVTSQSGKVPYLQGISLSRANEYYWEKLADKKAGKTYFEYHIKYPFPEFELKKLVMDFNINDKKLTEELNRLEEEVETVSSVEQIESNLDQLKALQEAFIDARLDRTNTVAARYRNLYKAIELTETESGRGLLKFSLMLNGRQITTVKKPVVTSECARINGTKNGENGWEISYNYDNCYEDPENNINVAFRFGNNNLSRKFYFDISGNKASIYVNEAVRFVKVTNEADNILTFDCNVTLVSKYDSPVEIQKVTFEIRGAAPVIIENVGQIFTGKGNHDLKLRANGPLPGQVTTSTGKTNPVLSGYIQYRNQTTGESETYRVYSLKYSTSW